MGEQVSADVVGSMPWGSWGRTCCLWQHDVLGGEVNAGAVA